MGWHERIKRRSPQKHARFVDPSLLGCSLAEEPEHPGKLGSPKETSLCSCEHRLVANTQRIHDDASDADQSPGFCLWLYPVQVAFPVCTPETTYAHHHMRWAGAHPMHPTTNRDRADSSPPHEARPASLCATNICLSRIHTASSMTRAMQIKSPGFRLWLYSGYVIRRITKSFVKTTTNESLGTQQCHRLRWWLVFSYSMPCISTGNLA